MSRAVARRIDSASSRRARIVIFAPGKRLRANASHSARMGSIFARMNSASRIDSSIGGIRMGGRYCRNAATGKIETRF